MRGKAKSAGGDVQLLTVREAAGRLAMSVPWVYAEMDRGGLPYVKLGRSRRVDAADVAALAERNKIGGRP